jgi:hypothetical protein
VFPDEIKYVKISPLSVVWEREIGQQYENITYFVVGMFAAFASTYGHEV